MESEPRKIEDIMRAHSRLVSAYDYVLKKTSNSNRNVKSKFEIPNPFLLRNQFNGSYERILYVNFALAFAVRWPLEVIRMFLGSLAPLIRVSYRFEPRVHWNGRIVCWRFFLKYLIIFHIRRNYVRLYGLYQREILLQNRGKESPNGLDDFRLVADDLKKHIDDMPDPRRFFVSITAILSLIAFLLSSVGWLLGVAGINPNEAFSPYITETNLSIVAGIVLALGMVALFPFAEAFGVKRLFFVEPSVMAYYFRRDVFLQNGDKLYRDSIYKLEDDLYSALDASKEQPDEIDYELLFSFPITAFFTLLFGFLAFVILVILPANIPANGLAYFQGIGVMALMVLLYAAITGFAMPILGWRNRRKYKMT